MPPNTHPLTAQLHLAEEEAGFRPWAGLSAASPIISPTQRQVQQLSPTPQPCIPGPGVRPPHQTGSQAGWGSGHTLHGCSPGRSCLPHSLGSGSFLSPRHSHISPSAYFNSPSCLSNPSLPSPSPSPLPLPCCVHSPACSELGLRKLLFGLSIGPASFRNQKHRPGASWTPFPVGIQPATYEKEAKVTAPRGRRSVWCHCQEFPRIEFVTCPLPATFFLPVTFPALSDP